MAADLKKSFALVSITTGSSLLQSIYVYLPEAGTVSPAEQLLFLKNTSPPQKDLGTQKNDIVVIRPHPSTRVS